MGDVLGVVGQIVSSMISAKAQKAIAAAQIAALERQRKFVFENLDPELLGPKAAKADIANAKARLKLQKELSPELYAARGEAEANIRERLKSLGVSSERVADQAVKEALTGADVAAQGKQQLIDAALKQLSLGATLPADVQAELVKAGLEKGGMVTGAASPKGIGGQLTRTLLGSAGIALQQQREQQAVGLLGQAQNLENSRAQLLGQLFPNLVATENAKIGGLTTGLAGINSMMPAVGLSGNDVLNLWLARVGATTNIERDKTQAGYLGAMGAAAEMQKAWGAGSTAAANAIPASTSNYWKSGSTTAATAGGGSNAASYSGGGGALSAHGSGVGGYSAGM